MAFKNKILRSGCIAVGLMAALSAWASFVVPLDKSVAIHWGMNGKPDSFAPAWFAFWLLPGWILFISWLASLKASTEADPDKETATASMLIWQSALTVLVLAHSLVLLYAAGFDVPVSRTVLAAVSCLLIMAGYQTRKIKAMKSDMKWFVPNEEANHKINKLIGTWLMALGIIGLPFSVGGPLGVYVVLLLSGMVGMTLCMVVYAAKLRKAG